MSTGADADNGEILAKNPTGGHLIVQSLLGEGVDTVFGITGSHVIAIYDALRDTPQIRHITARHENNAALMAEAYARLSGKPGVVIVTAGPGATNALSGIAQAYTTHSPVVIITGSVLPNAKKEVFHGVDDPTFLHKVFSSVTKLSVRIERASDVPQVMAAAFSRAISGRPGPVHVEIDENVLKSVAEATSPYSPMPRYKPTLDAATAGRIVDALRQADRPLIIAGKGVLATAAQEDLARMADLLAAPVVFPGDAYGAMSYGDRWCVGVVGAGINANPLANKLFGEADLLLGVGLRPNSANMDLFLREAKGKLVFIGFDDEQVAHQGAFISCVAETKPALRELIRLFEPHRRKPNREQLVEIEANKQYMLQLFRDGMQTYRENGPLHFGLALEELVKHLPPDAILVGDIGNHNSWSTALLPRWGVDNLLQVGPWAAMGYGLPGAIGAKVACPERTVVGLTGDGAFIMNCADFPTAVQQKLDIVYVVLNDGRHGMVEMLQRRGYGRTYATEIPPSDLVRFAESFGAAGIRVSQRSELRDAFQRAFQTRGPVVVEIMSDSSIPYVSIPG